MKKKSILEYTFEKEKLKFADKLKLSWYFDTWYEKIALFILLIFFIYAMIRISMQGLW